MAIKKERKLGSGEGRIGWELNFKEGGGKKRQQSLPGVTGTAKKGGKTSSKKIERAETLV